MKWSIRTKFFICLLLLFSIAAILVLHVVKVTLQTNSEQAIEAELTKLQHTTREHIKQFMLIQPPKEDLFQEYGAIIAQQLSKLHQQSVTIYNSEGTLLNEAILVEQPILMTYRSTQASPDKLESDDLALAFANKSAFTLVDVEGGKLVNFSYPLYIHDHYYGVLRFTGDYSDLFSANERILQGLTLFIICLFISVFLLSFLLISQMLKPLLRLTKATKQVAAGNYDIDVRAKTGDEIEQLTNSFHDMKQEIRRKIETIKKEKDKVLLLEKSRRTFFNNVTHELKTPLTTISGYAQIIGADNFSDQAFLQKAARNIREESDRLSDLVVEVINISKKDAAPVKTKETIDVYPFLSAICEDMSLKARKHKMSISLSGEDFIIDGVKNELKQVFINVLDNAIKYGMSGKTIDVAISKQTIIIQNDSPPIEKAVLEHIFEPFVHTARNAQEKGSSGLGLYICSQIISSHNGTISFTYENGIATLQITFPKLATI